MARPKTPRPSDVFRVRIKDARKARGWSQEQLALKADMYKTIVTKLETGQRKDVTLDEVVALAAALDVSPGHLIFPLGADAKVRLGHRTVTTAAIARAWLRGQGPLSTSDDARRFYASQSPDDAAPSLGRDEVEQLVSDQVREQLPAAFAAASADLHDLLDRIDRLAERED